MSDEQKKNKSGKNTYRTLNDGMSRPGFQPMPPKPKPSPASPGDTKSSSNKAK